MSIRKFSSSRGFKSAQSQVVLEYLLSERELDLQVLRNAVGQDILSAALRPQGNTASLRVAANLINVFSRLLSSPSRPGTFPEFVHPLSGSTHRSNCVV